MIILSFISRDDYDKITTKIAVNSTISTLSLVSNIVKIERSSKSENLKDCVIRYPDISSPSCSSFQIIGYDLLKEIFTKKENKIYKIKLNPFRDYSDKSVAENNLKLIKDKNKSRFPPFVYLSNLFIPIINEIFFWDSGAKKMIYNKFIEDHVLDIDSTYRALNSGSDPYPLGICTHYNKISSIFGLLYPRFSENDYNKYEKKDYSNLLIIFNDTYFNASTKKEFMKKLTKQEKIKINKIKKRDLENFIYANSYEINDKNMRKKLEYVTEF